MAVTNIINQVLTRGQSAVLAAGTAIGSDGILLVPAADERMLLMLKNTASSSASVTLGAGNGIFGRDAKTIAVGASETVLLTLQRGAHPTGNGAGAGSMMITGDSDVEISAIVMP